MVLKLLQVRIIRSHYSKTEIECLFENGLRINISSTKTAYIDQINCRNRFIISNLGNSKHIQSQLQKQNTNVPNSISERFAKCKSSVQR